MCLPERRPHGAERERARLIAHVPLRGADEIDDHGLAAADGPGGRALGHVGVRPQPDERRVGPPRLRRGRPGGDGAVVNLAVEGTHPQDSLVPLTAQPGFHVRGELDLGHPLAEDRRQAVGHPREHRARLADPLQLPGALHGTQAPELSRAVGELIARQAARVIEIAGGGQHVELEPEPAALDSGRGQRTGEVAEGAKRLDALER